MRRLPLILILATALPFSGLGPRDHPQGSTTVEAASVGKPSLLPPWILIPPLNESGALAADLRPQATTTTTTMTVPVPTTVVAYHPAAASAPASGTYSMSPLLRRIGGCESNGSPTAPLAWTKWNTQGSGADGAFQDLPSSWQTWEHRFGTNGYPFTIYAADAPPAEQIYVNAAELRHDSTGAWSSSSSCWA